MKNWTEESNKMERQIYFVSGHLDLTQEDFNREYKGKIELAAGRGSLFVVGDAKGCDAMVQKLLLDLSVNNVIVYHIGDKPRNNLGLFHTKGKFKSDEDRDSAMTNDSNEDIAWVRGEEESKKLYGDKYREGRVSGTMKNLLRRKAQASMKLVSEWRGGL